MFRITHREVKSLFWFKLLFNWYTFVFDMYVIIVYCVNAKKDADDFGIFQASDCPATCAAKYGDDDDSLSTCNTQCPLAAVFDLSGIAVQLLSILICHLFLGLATTGSLLFLKMLVVGGALSIILIWFIFATPSNGDEVAAIASNVAVLIGILHLAVKLAVIVVRAANFFVRTYWTCVKNKWWFVLLWPGVLLSFVSYTVFMFFFSSFLNLAFVVAGAVFILPIFLPDLLSAMSGQGHIVSSNRVAKPCGSLMRGYYKYCAFMLRSKVYDDVALGGDQTGRRTADKDLEDPNGAIEDAQDKADEAQNLEGWAEFFSGALDKAST